MKWIPMPTGRWATTIEAHGGRLALHAWLGGEWAVTRGQVTIKAGELFVTGSREEGQPTGRDLQHAMELAEAAARIVVDRERPSTGKPVEQTQPTLF